MHVVYLSTARAVRGRSIGSTLLDFFAIFWRKRGMSLLVASENAGARWLYSRFGYL